MSLVVKVKGDLVNKQALGDSKSSTTAAMIIAMAESDREIRPELSIEKTAKIESDTLNILKKQLPEDSVLRRTLDKTEKEQRKDFRSVTTNGSTLHMQMRRRLVSQQVDNFLNENKDGANVVVLGAGFDFNSYAIHKENPKTNFLEVDVEGTSRNKQKILQQLSDKHGEIGGNLKFAQATLGEKPIADVLTEKNGFDKTNQTLVCAQGV